MVVTAARRWDLWMFLKRQGDQKVSEWPQDKGDAQDTDGLAFNSSPAPGLIVLPEWNFSSVFPPQPPRPE